MNFEDVASAGVKKALQLGCTSINIRQGELRVPNQ